MTVSMRVMSARDGYKYLLRTVAAGDGPRNLSTPLTRFYNADGTPPGRWISSGLAVLGSRQLHDGDEVTEAQLQLLIGMGRDPVTGEPLARAYPAYKSAAERVGERVGALDPELGPTAQARAVAAIETEESERGTRRAVAGYDYPFSIPKSGSVFWAVADARTQSLFVGAHHAGVAEVVAFMECEVATTRAGATPGDGAVAHIEARSSIATAAVKLRGGGFGRPCPPIFPELGGRHSQREFRDALADLMPNIEAWAPTFRIGDFEVRAWLSDNSSELRMAAILFSKGLSLREIDSRLSLKLPRLGRRDPRESRVASSCGLGLLGYEAIRDGINDRFMSDLGSNTYDTVRTWRLLTAN